jgi:hypothetical protein
MLAMQRRDIPFREAMTDNTPVPVYDIRPGHVFPRATGVAPGTWTRGHTRTRFRSMPAA